MGQCNVVLFAALARQAELLVSEFNAQNIVNAVWAFSTLGHLDKALFAALATEAQLRVCEFDAQEFAMITQSCT